MRAAKRNGDEQALTDARARVGAAKRGLGERGPYWWERSEEERLEQARQALRELDRRAPRG